MQQRWGATAFETPHDLDRIDAAGLFVSSAVQGFLETFGLISQVSFDFFAFHTPISAELTELLVLSHP